MNSVKFLQAIFTKYYSIQAIDGSKKYVPPLAYFFVFINGYKSGANRESLFWQFKVLSIICFVFKLNDNDEENSCRKILSDFPILFCLFVDV